MTEEKKIEHRLKIIIDDASYLLEHLRSGGKMESLTKLGDNPWSLWVNVEIALDLSDDTCYEWKTSKEYNEANS